VPGLCGGARKGGLPLVVILLPLPEGLLRRQDGKNNGHFTTTPTPILAPPHATFIVYNFYGYICFYYVYHDGAHVAFSFLSSFPFSNLFRLSSSFCVIHTRLFYIHIHLDLPRFRRCSCDET
jgi:hypothetical protein